MWQAFLIYFPNQLPLLLPPHCQPIISFEESMLFMGISLSITLLSLVTNTLATNLYKDPNNDKDRKPSNREEELTLEIKVKT